MSTSEWLIKVDQLVENGEEGQMAQAEEDRWQQPYIYKLPAYVTNSNKNAYTPHVVSFGPYHCRNENLKAMEEHKERALVHFLKRSKVSIKRCFESLGEIMNELMDAYDSLDADLKQNGNAFLEVMIRDGCFMLEIFHFQQWNISDSRPGGKFEGYAAKDPIFSKHGDLYVMPLIKRDMLMLENQLPMKVLRKLCQLQPTEKNDPDKLAFEFFFPKSKLKAPSECLHILDMYRKSILGPDLQQKKNTNIPGIGDNIKQSVEKPQGQTEKERNPKQDSGDELIRSAVELEEAGINIKRSTSRNLTDITFENGELRLPMITVDDLTEQLFLNLIAYERLHVGAGNEVTAYAIFMDNIIDDAPDIRLLHYKNIIQNAIGSDKAAAKLFNSLTKDVAFDKSSPLGEVYKNVNAYCKKKIPKYRAVLYHTYLTSPWATISVLAAIFLFALTITQTVYSILPFYKP